MKRAKKKPAPDEMRSEYDFSSGVRGKYTSRATRKTTVVLLEPDVAQVFKTSESVNSALRALVAIARPKKRRSAS